MICSNIRKNHITEINGSIRNKLAEYLESSENEEDSSLDCMCEELANYIRDELFDFLNPQNNEIESQIKICVQAYLLKDLNGILNRKSAALNIASKCFSSPLSDSNYTIEANYKDISYFAHIFLTERII